HRCPSALPYFPTRRSSDLNPVIWISALHPGGLFRSGDSAGPTNNCVTKTYQSEMLVRVFLGARDKTQITTLRSESMHARISALLDRKSTRLNSSHVSSSYA